MTKYLGIMDKTLHTLEHNRKYRMMTTRTKSNIVTKEIVLWCCFLVLSHVEIHASRRVLIFLRLRTMIMLRARTPQIGTKNV
jgi:hypothetical protein